MGEIRTALEETLASEPSLTEARNAALVSLCRVIADRIDAQGDRASGQIVVAYLSALKDVTRAMGDEKPAALEKAGGKLRRLQIAHGTGA